GRLLLGKKSLIPCTAAAALTLLKSSDVSLKGKQAVIIGRSDIVGKPLGLLLLKEDMTVTICHSKTEDIEEHVHRADVVVAALGRKRFVQGSWLQPGAIVIDVGINDDNGKTVGDVDFDSCKERASFITPVPGGVGPVTSVMLMKNVLEAFKHNL
ncbi:MAG: bifunctional 5,10-methylene-tetrahydrofolate dehydrogenase/5,10-methylene-tetrahydrofolate cyclohydrolase, partial [Candidatus Omnitrophota bacterium]